MRFTISLKRSGPSFTAILYIYTAYCESQCTCKLLFVDRSFCLGQNLADWPQAYFHSQKATVKSAAESSSPSSADRPGIWERQKLGVVVQTETRCRDFLGTRRVRNCRPKTPLLVIVAMESTGLSHRSITYTAARGRGCWLPRAWE